MYSYILEHGDEQQLNTTLSAKAQIYLLLHLVCPVEREILDYIYLMKREMEDEEKRELLVKMNPRNFYPKNVESNYHNVSNVKIRDKYNKKKQFQMIERKSLLLINQLRCLYPGFIRYYYDGHRQCIETLFETPLTKKTVRGHKNIEKLNIQFNTIKIVNVIHRYIENNRTYISIDNKIDNWERPDYNCPFDVNFWWSSTSEKFFDSMRRNIEFNKGSTQLPEHLPMMDTITVHTNYRCKLRIIPPYNNYLSKIDCFKKN